MQSYHLRILIERETRTGGPTLSPAEVAEKAVAKLLEKTGGRIRGFNVEGYTWMEKDRTAPTVALSSLVEGWDRELEENVRKALRDLCRDLDQDAIAVALIPAESFIITRQGREKPL